VAENRQGLIKATLPYALEPAATPPAAPPLGGQPAAPAAPAAPSAGSSATGADTTLPDPTWLAKWVLIALVGAAVVVALVLNLAGWTAKPFDPAKNATADFALFAGFYVGAQVIERLLQLISPWLPWPWGWPIPSGLTGAAKAAQLKADRAHVTLGVAAVLGVVASCSFGLFFLQAIGISCSNTVDTFVTGITIAAGTKPLHDFISLLQNKNTPTTGTTA
jgi:hypothetical protein